VKNQNDEKYKNPPIRLTPVCLLQRHHLPEWKEFAQHIATGRLSSPAQKVAELLDTKGALFFTDLVMQSGLLRTQVEIALGELASWGLVSSDGFAGLRALITPSSKLPRFSGRRGRAAVSSPFDRAGRWSLLFSPKAADDHEPVVATDDAIELVAHTLLLRYGVVFRRVLERETSLPPWRDLLRVYWRMEARGEIRGGRFVKGVSGEQFALPEGLGSLRKIQRQEKSGDLVVISASDPLNLTGTLLPCEKVAIASNKHIVFRDGVPIAVQHKQDIDYLCELDEQTQWDARLLLSRQSASRGSSRAH
jgi:ATP-dependent Lhr-like helicase